jgi:hypothetical protein
MALTKIYELDTVFFNMRINECFKCGQVMSRNFFSTKKQDILVIMMTKNKGSVEDYTRNPLLANHM